MANTVASIARRRKALRARITTLDNAIIQGKIDKINARLRLSRITEIFKDYEGLEHTDEIQDNYYVVATKVENMIGAGTSGSSAILNGSGILTFTRLYDWWCF